MKRTTPEQRQLMADAVRRGNNKNVVAKIFGVCAKTVVRWLKRALDKRIKILRDKPRKAKESKITERVELSILALRNTFNWGTERIRKALCSLPKFMLDTLLSLGVKVVQKVQLSRTAINNVLRKHKLNGYKKKYKKWKFFRAKKANELWQLDIKGPFKVEGKKYYFVICIDDYSRYLLLAEQLDHCPNIQEICSLLRPLVRKHKPESILTDNNPLKEEWDSWCKEDKIKSLKAHLYYPQDKGKVERAIRNISEEFVYLLKKFPEWLNGKIKQYQRWHNRKRFNKGVNAIHYELYT